VISDSLKKKALDLVKKATEKKLVKDYDEFCETEDAKEGALSEEDVLYYTSRYERRR